jgi:hypothetical protein
VSSETTGATQPQSGRRRRGRVAAVNRAHLVGHLRSLAPMARLLPLGRTGGAELVAVQARTPLRRLRSPCPVTHLRTGQVRHGDHGCPAERATIVTAHHRIHTPRMRPATIAVGITSEVSHEQSGSTERGAASLKEWGRIKGVFRFGVFRSAMASCAPTGWDAPSPRHSTAPPVSMPRRTPGSTASSSDAARPAGLATCPPR